MFETKSQQLLNPVRPHYINTSQGQLRIWTANEGPDLVVLPGLGVSAASVARRMALQFSQWRVTVLELPGIGGSAKVPSADVVDMAEVMGAALQSLGVAAPVLIAFDLAGALAVRMAERFFAVEDVYLMDFPKAQAWVTGAVSLPDIGVRANGTHLPALWAHFRDCNVLDAHQPTHVGTIGLPLPMDHELDEAVVAAAVNPEGYQSLWSSCLAAVSDMSNSGRAAGVTVVESEGELSTLLDVRRAARPGATELRIEPPADGRLHYDYVQISTGDVHLRRVGNGSRVLLVFQSAPGSAEPLEYLMQGLATDRTVIACDYPGNGDSDKAPGDIDIGTLADYMIEVADALQLEQVDLFGTHTGALVALEFALRQPQRVGQVILEAPPLLDSGFTDDILTNYLPPLVPDRWGTHTMRAWNMRRDMFLFWPWYRQSRNAARSLGLPDLRSLHTWTVGLLKSGSTYHLSYGAAFRYDTKTRLPLLRAPTLFCAGPADMLVDGLDAAKEIVSSNVRVAATPATVWYPGQPISAVRETVQVYDAFLREQ